MELGLFTSVFRHLDFEQMLAEVSKYPAIRELELGCGGWPGSEHVAIDKLLESVSERAVFLSRLQDAGLSLSALACHGNPVHPDEAIANRDDIIFQRTVELASQLGVRTVVTFSGCPGGSAGDNTPNWITAAWPPEYASALKWQWEAVLIPYWKRAAAIAATHDVKIALEAHPGFAVYNSETLLKLRAAAGDTIGINFDPSHLWWQGIEPASAIASLGGAIFHVHAKDVALQPEVIQRNGVLDMKSYTAFAERSWNFRTVGWGHDALAWKKLISALRIAGYDGVISIEHEDALASVEEGLRNAVDFLDPILLRERPVDAWWA